MKHIEKIYNRVTPVLPAIYGESLSYAEELGKIKQGFNEMVDNQDEMVERLEQAEDTVDSFEGRMETAERDITNLKNKDEQIDEELDGIHEQIGNNTLGTSIPKYNADFQDHEYELSGTLASLEDGQVGLVQKACPVPNDDDPSETDPAIIYRAKVNGWDEVKSDITGLQEKLGNNTVKTSVPRYNVQFTDHEYEIVDEHDDIYEGLEDGQVALLQKECATPNDSDPTEKFPELLTTTKVKGWEKVVTDERVWGLTEVEGNPITLEVVQENEAKGAVVKFEPKQNLNGYEYPWAGGANVNKAGFHTGGYVDASGAKVQNSQYGMTDVLAIGTSLIVDRGTAEHMGYAIFSDAECTTMIARSESDNTHDSMVYPVPSGAGTQYALCWWDLGSGVTASQSTMDTAHCMCVVDGASADWTPYANVCPIEGWTELKVNGCGKNLVNGIKHGYFVRAENPQEGSPIGAEVNNSIYSCTLFINVKPNTNYVSTSPAYISASSAGLVFYDKNKEAISGISTLSQNSAIYVFTTPNNCEFVRFSWYNVDGDNAQLEVGTTATPYEPYAESNDITVALGQTVYGGELDVVRGEVKVNMAIVDLGTLIWNRGFNAFYSTDIKNSSKKYNNLEELNAKCTHYKAIRSTSTVPSYNFSIYPDSGSNYTGYLIVNDPRYQSTLDFKTAINGAMLVYELATPTTITGLTPAQISLLEGVNTLWTDGKSLDVLYVSDIATIKQLNDKLAQTIGDIAGTEYATATSNHAVNDFIIYDGGFYKVISAITVGDTLVVDTNIRKTTVGAEITAILNANSNRETVVEKIAKEVAEADAEESTEKE